ncbi:putative reverse transcriptase domain-containing protein [Tanacetum coccineum]
MISSCDVLLYCRTMPNTRSGATMTREGISELIGRHVAEALEAHNTTRNFEPLAEDRNEHEDENGDDYEDGNVGNGNGGNGNGGDGNGGDGNGNENGRGNGYNFGGFMPVAREFTYQDFLNALTWWNSHKRTVGVDAAYAMKWTKLMKLMTEVYCLRNEIQKMETELWNLAIKGNDLTAYIRRFQELVLLCTRMVSEEEDKVERFIGGLPNNIQGNVITAEPTGLQDAIRIANNLMDQKLKGYARSAEYKRRFDNNPRDNRGQQPAFKRQNVGGQNVARAYTVGNNERKGRAPVRNQPGIVCYECGRVGHYKKDCPKLRNQNCGNKTGNKTRNKTGSDRSFVSSTFSALLDVAPSTSDTSYVVELADGRI